MFLDEQTFSSTIINSRVSQCVTTKPIHTAIHSDFGVKPKLYGESGSATRTDGFLLMTESSSSNVEPMPALPTHTCENEIKTLKPAPCMYPTANKELDIQHSYDVTLGRSGQGWWRSPLDLKQKNTSNNSHETNIHSSGLWCVSRNNSNNSTVIHFKPSPSTVARLSISAATASENEWETKQQSNRTGVCPDVSATGHLILISHVSCV